jgi:hypothetical protein
MKRDLLIKTLIALTAFATIAVSADAQTRARANTQSRGLQANYEQTAQYEHVSCPIYRIWMTEQGIVFACNGNAMVFEGGEGEGSLASAMTLLISLQENDRSAFVRYTVDRNNAACSQMDWTRYQGMFADGICARAVSFGVG